MVFDLLFISGNFFDINIPKDKKYLKKYFRTSIEKQFLRYYIVFNTRQRFLEHTGCFVKKRWLQVLEKRFKDLTIEHQNAKLNFDLEKLELIESGKFFKKRIINSSC